jgi:pyridoxal phosphate enzyme (YggS family)
LAGLNRRTYSRRMPTAADRLHQVQAEIAAAAKLSGRAASDIVLIAVSKARAVQDIEALIAAGQKDFGESRVQETLGKWPALRSRYPDVRLHCIGRLQSNKAAEAVRLFDVIHSVDRPSLLRSLVEEGEKTGRFPSVYVQVNIGDEEQKGGCALGDLPDLIQAVRASPLPLSGLMAIPPIGVEPAPYFALLAKLARRHDAKGLSMGMSSDFPAAVKLGATAVRVGTALFE